MSRHLAPVLEHAVKDLPFSVDALVDVAVKAAGARFCTSFGKMGEELIARLPFHTAGAKHFMTASEVATMDYARTELGLPVPRVLAWSSRTENTPVGAEFMVYEKVPGVSSSSRWFDSRVRAIFGILKTIIGFEKVMIHQKPLAQIGSLYFKEDLPSHLQAHSIYANDSDNTPNSRRFCIGPTVDRSGKLDAALNIDRGPWSTIHEYAYALSACERAWLQRDPDNPPAPEHLKLLHDYDKFVPHMVVHSSDYIIWHPDMHLDNVIVSEDDSCHVTGLIDWQTAESNSLFQQVVEWLPLRYRPSPYVIFDPESETLEPPKRAPGHEDLDGETRRQAERAFYQANRAYVYKGLMRTSNPAMFATLDAKTLQVFGLNALRTVAMGRADRVAMMKEMLVYMCDNWRLLQAAMGADEIPCPVNYTDEERELVAEEMSNVRERLQHRLDIFTSPDAYTEDLMSLNKFEEVKRACDKIRNGLLDAAATP